MTTLEVLFTPAEFAVLSQRDLSRTTCVVFDVLRATSTMVTALANGAVRILPAADIPEALELRRRQPDVLLAGERNGVRICSELTGGVDFELGNSPREFSPERVRDRTVVMTTTNGTRALRACAGAQAIIACSFLNLGATAAFLRLRAADELLVVCSGTREEAAYEDVLGAGALCELLVQQQPIENITDSAQMSRQLFERARADLPAALGESRNGRRLLAIPELCADVALCARIDQFRLVAEARADGALYQRPG